MTAPLDHRKSGGILPDSKIRATPAPINPDSIASLRQINDLSSTVSDVLDHLGVISCVGASILRPTIVGKTVVGRAITVRNVPQKRSSYLNAEEDLSLMNELEGINQSSPGDVLVIQGVPNVSNMGGMVATIAKHHGLVGAVVDGGVRDVGRSRANDFPVWSRDISPITGKYRCVTEEVNGTINVCGVTVNAGDLVVADETGVCFVPQQYINDVLAACRKIDDVEKEWLQDCERGLSIPDIMKKVYKQLRDK
ncbi:RraA family protein [Pseudorhodoplanes sp.]|uniref:RraA family protein n=1 Tax=Pseudorhodoplanes sp. TaxID=1934341 RepID=UPI002D1DEBA2|nr:RraA family protein [Pseudorhodoplanes sp.]HWV41940.1 RraA family protein [Pseudorhodoplanes sp.]